MHRIKTKYFVRRGNGFVHTALPGINKFIRPFLFLIVLNETLLLHQAGTSTVAAMEQAESKAMDQIGILKIGDKYFSKAQKICNDINETCLVNSIAYLIALIYTLHSKYPTQLTTLFVFFEHVFEMNVSRKSVPARTLYAEAHVPL